MKERYGTSGVRRVKVGGCLKDMKERGKGGGAEGGGEESNKHCVPFLSFTLDLNLHPVALDCVCNKVMSQFKN